ncbi:MAG: hypothetical protein DME23_09660 [Verrucomicrobia bacterium]|nr:MAG: hypothetical protein DME23_09660 [Verrucomicrobiota bacterium]
MKRGRIIALVVLAILLVGLLFVFLLPREPVYEGRLVSEWIEQLTGAVGSGAGAVSSHVLPKLVQQKPGKEIVPYLCQTLYRGKSLKDRIYARLYLKLPAALLRKLPPPNPGRDAELRYRAALILYYLGPDAEKAAPDLTRALRDENPEVRRVAASTLGNLGFVAKRSAPGLIALLEDPMTDVRRAALKALGQVEDDAAVVVPATAQMLKDTDSGVRTDAAQVLRDLGPKARTALGALTEALSDQNDDVFRFAAMALGKIGPDAKEAVPALLQALRENRAYSETTIRWALRQIDPLALTKATASR